MTTTSKHPTAKGLRGIGFFQQVLNMNWYTHWEIVYRYFRRQGIPHNVLSYFSISPLEAAQISRIIKSTRPKAILEVGTFIGLSTGIIALASDPESTIVCVDPNAPIEILSAKCNFFDQRGSLFFVQKMLEHFGMNQRVHLLEGFFSCSSSIYDEQYIASGGNPEVIKKHIDVVGKGTEAYAPYDLVFLDGDHTSTGVYSDLSFVYPSLSQNGIIVLHDVSGSTWGEQVRKGANQFMHDHPDFSLKIDHNLGFLSRDAEKVWLIPQRKSLVGRVRRKILSLSLN